MPNPSAERLMYTGGSSEDAHTTVVISNEVLKFLMSSVDALKVTKQAAQACRDTELDALVSLRAQDVVMQKHDSEGPISIERMEQYVELYFDPASGQNGVHQPRS